MRYGGVQRECVYRFVLLPGHVSSEDALHGEGSIAFASVAGSLHVHALVFLNDDGGSCAAQKLRQAVNHKRKKFSTFSSFYPSV